MVDKKKDRYLPVAVIVIVVLMIVSCYPKREDTIESTSGSKETGTQSPESSSAFMLSANRKAYAIKLNGVAGDSRLEYGTDSNDSTILWIRVKEDMRPDQIVDYSGYLNVAKTSPEELKKMGFTKVRLYTSLSEDINDYSLRSLN